ncbi:outer membrane beta-barrel protein [Rapidithrix thailandica]|uniref:Outer membrane beta-barrel protein n=1 Tax=Rapidithrix thailandica TaxID=413964 RepID=A0AAW9SAW0_9BACT
MKSSDKKHKTNFENAWQDALEGGEYTPSSEVWGNIESALDEQKGFVVWKRPLAAAAAAVALLVVGYLGYRTIDQGAGPNELAYESITTIGDSATKLSQEMSAEQQPSLHTNPSGKTMMKNQNPSLARENQIVDAEEAGGRAVATTPTVEPVRTAPEPGLAQVSGDVVNPKPTTSENTTINNVQNHPHEEKSTINTLNTIAANIPSAVTAPSTTDTENKNIANGEKEVFVSSGNNALANTSKKEEEVTNTRSIKPGAEGLGSDPVYAAYDNSSVENEVLDLLEKPEGVPMEVAFNEPGLINPANDWYKNLPVAKKRKEAFEPEVFAQINLGGDRFDPNYHANGNVQNSYSKSYAPGIVGAERLPEDAANQVMNEVNEPAVSLTYGVNVGMRVAKRWVVESGVTYGNYNTKTQTSVSVSDAPHNEIIPVTMSSNAATLKSSKFVSVSSTYKVNNSYEFASIPLRAGYMILNKKINWIVKAGVTSDFFLGNEIKNEGEGTNIKSYRINSGDEDSPFRSMFFNGTVGNEVSLRLNSSYSLSLEANYKFALNSFTKDGQPFTSNPNSLGVGMVFRYFFK